MPLIDVGQRKVYHEVHGDPAETPLLLVTGMGGSCRGWLPLQVPAFAKSHRVVCYDHRGVGGSSDPGGAFSTPLLADDAVALLDALEIERAHVLGSFMGGMVAQEMALRHPGRVDRLVLTGTFARPDAKRRLLLEHWSELARSGASLETLIRERLLWTLRGDTLESSDLIESMIAFLAKDGSPLSADVLERQCDACLGHDTLDRLGDIPHATLVTCGEQDRLTPPALNRQVADGIPTARYVAIPFAAHLVLLEAAEHYNRLVLQFIAGDS
jgi:pimeloyl-ACP methyl ester carboxylesterase